MPWTIGYRPITYDMLLFDQWGVEYLNEYPTPAEILDKAGRMTGINPVSGEENFGVHLAANSLNMSFLIPASEAFGNWEATGDWGDPRNIRWALNSPAYVQAVTWAADLIRFAPPAAATGQGAENMGRENNNVAIYMDRGGGAIMGHYYRTGDTTMVDRFNVTMHVGWNGGNWTPADSMCMNANLSGADADMAWELIKYMVGPEIATWRFNNWGPSPMPHLISAQLYDPKDKFLAMNDRIVAASSHPGYEINPFYGSSIQPVLAEILSRSLAGETVNIQQMMDELQANAERWSSTR
jgi:hypothetical protein